MKDGSLNSLCIDQVDTVSRSHQLLCMPMLGVTLAWKQRLADEPPAPPLLALLDQCAARLLQHYSLVLRDKVDAIARCAFASFRWSPTYFNSITKSMSEFRFLCGQVHNQRLEYAARSSIHRELCEHG